MSLGLEEPWPEYIKACNESVELQRLVKRLEFSISQQELFLRRLKTKLDEYEYQRENSLIQRDQIFRSLPETRKKLKDAQHQIIAIELKLNNLIQEDGGPGEISQIKDHSISSRTI